MRSSLFFLFVICRLLSFAQVIENPVFNRTDQPLFHVDKVEITQDSTIVFCTLLVEEGMWANISPDTYIEDIETHRKYTIAKSEGLPFAPKQREFVDAGKYNVSFFFPHINNAKVINLIECPTEKAFNVYGIRLTNDNTLLQSVSEDSFILNIQSMITNGQHDKVDSILNVYKGYSLSKDDMFIVYLLSSLNGFAKTQTYNNMSLIVPYKDDGKRAFEYLKNNVNKDNAEGSNCWNILPIYAKIYNYLNDIIVVDIADFAKKYYSELGQSELLPLFSVLLNAYQYYFAHHEWEKAIELMDFFYHQALERKEENIFVAISCGFIGSSSLYGKNMAEAKKWLDESYLRYQQYEERNTYYAYYELLTHLAYLYHTLGDSSEGLKFSIEACNLTKSKYGEFSKEYINSLALRGDCEIRLQGSKEGLKYLEEAVALLDNASNMSQNEKQAYRDKLKFAYQILQIKKSVDSNDSIETENSVILEASSAYAQGNTEKAIERFSYLLEIYENNFQSVSLDNFIFVTTSLSNIMAKEGNLVEADKVLDKALVMLRENKVDTKLTRYIYVAKGEIHYALGDNLTSIDFYRKAAEIFKQVGDKGVAYARLLSDIALIEVSVKMYESAFKKLNEADSILNTFYSDNSKDAADILMLQHNIAIVYIKMGENTKGINLLNNIIIRAQTPDKIRVKTMAMSNLAETFMSEKKYKESMKLLENALSQSMDDNIREQAKADLLFCKIMQTDESVINELKQYNEESINSVSTIFKRFPEAEREGYWNQKSQFLVFLNNVAAETFNNLAVCQEAYNNALYTKSLLLNSTRLLGDVIHSISDVSVKNKYNVMQNYKKRLSQKTIDVDSIGVIKSNINQMEKDILTAIPNFSSLLASKFKTWNDVQSMLGDNEVAIEFVFLPEISFPTEKSKLRYGALLLTKDSDAPTLIYLCEDSELKSLLDNNVSDKLAIDTLYSLENNKLYDLLWKRIDPYLHKGANVYYSPCGQMHRINLSAVSNGTTRIEDEYNLYLLSTTADIEQRKEIPTEISSAALYGDIDYFEDMTTMANESKSYSMLSSGELLANNKTRSQLRNSWDILPETKEEINAIKNLFVDNNINVNIYSGTKANEESIKAMDGNAPNIVHLATHGFYFPSGRTLDSDKIIPFFHGIESNTSRNRHMLYSGLLFAGANNQWMGDSIPNGIEDGILSAEEISHIDLSGTKLIVLSACETGLGDIDNINGVFGLQQGLKRAGVETILMSLWKVDDKATRILMVDFYKNLIFGKTKHQSLKDAQKHLRQIENGKYDKPEYWASFIILDGID